MNCLNCTGRRITTESHDLAVINQEIRELHRDCGKCGMVFIIYLTSNGALGIKMRDYYISQETGKLLRRQG